MIKAITTNVIPPNVPSSRKVNPSADKFSYTANQNKNYLQQSYLKTK